MKPHERLRVAREAKGWSKLELEERSGLSKGYLSRLEAGERGARAGGSTQMMQRLAAALGVRLEWLITGSGTMQEDTSDKLPKRTAAISIAREGGVDETILQALERENMPRAEERSVFWWIEEIQLRRARIEHDSQTFERTGTSADPSRIKKK